MKKCLLDIKELTVHFNAGRHQKIQAVSNVSFQIHEGETLGLVGESGCGKSTIANTIMQFIKPVSGQIFFQGEDLIRVSKKRLRQLRPQFQMIFQDSVSSLNPRRKIIDTIAEPLKVTEKCNREERSKRAVKMAKSVGLDPQKNDRRPFELSGGQCQRVQIARALIPGPKLLICDEPVSSLDVLVQAQIINLLEALRNKHRLSILFISHDLAVVKNVCDTVAVMYLGKLCEYAPSEKLYQSHLHPYTKELFESIPQLDPETVPKNIKIKPGEMQSPANPPTGCRYRTRCPLEQERCAEKEPALKQIEPAHYIACHFPK